jgi:hypothetical protein
MLCVYIFLRMQLSLERVIVYLGHVALKALPTVYPNSVAIHRPLLHSLTCSHYMAGANLFKHGKLGSSISFGHCHGGFSDAYSIEHIYTIFEQVREVNKTKLMPTNIHHKDGIAIFVISRIETSCE